ncbi:MAG: hypothetical protein Kow0020_02250 [Wenzhouxiangellaceae bacterium]
MRDKDEKGIERDEYDPGVSPEQRQKAEQVLKELGSRLTAFFEKRNLGEDYRHAELSGAPLTSPVAVLVSRHNAFDGDHIVLTETELPEIPIATIRYKGPGGEVRLYGRLTASHPGQRADDVREDGKRISVARFTPEPD